jgi:pimeloyl-ACP methyl ester carboxylesterase
MVVFIGDLATPGELWDTTLQHLDGQVEAHVVEIAGFAGNAATKGPLMPKLRDGLAGYLRDHHTKRPILVGHMFGAVIAYWLAMTEPDLVGGVVAVDAPPSIGQGSADPEAEEFRRVIRAADEAKFQRMMTRRFRSMTNDSERANRLAEKAVRSSPQVIGDAFYDMMTRDLRPQITHIRAPVLVFRTTGNIPPEALGEVEQHYREQLDPIPKHELVLVKDSKHFVMFDAPNAFFSHLDRFLASIPL